MKNLIQRVRDWLIKRLGGYTEKEYFRVNRPPLRLATPVETRNVQRLRATLVARPNVGMIENEDFVRRELAARLLPLVMENMRVTRVKKDYAMPGALEFEGRIDVVRED